MKANKYREKTVEELQQEAKTLRDQFLRLRFQSVSGSMENPQKLKAVRKDIARTLTVLRQKEGPPPRPRKRRRG